MRPALFKWAKTGLDFGSGSLQTFGIMIVRFMVILFAVIFGTVLTLFVARARALTLPIETPRELFFGEGLQIVAHRGGALEAPENTIAAFEQAALLGPDVFFEMDIHLSQDGVPVVIHDDDVSRTTEGSGRVKDFSLEKLQQFDAGYRFQAEDGSFPFRGKGVRIPTLEEVLDRFPGRKLIIEIKSSEYGIEEKVLSLIEKKEAQKTTMIGSQNSTLLNRFRKKNPHMFYCASHDEVLRSVLLASAFLEPLATIKSEAFLIPERDGNISVLSDRLLNELHRRSRRVLIWTVNTEEDMRRLISQGVDGLISDRPSLLYKVIKGQ